jgi:hypothetical protein
MRIRCIVRALGCAMCFLWVSPPAQAADAGRGQALYEARCDRCHGTSVHVREARKATSFQGVRTQVARWNTELGGAWSGDEIDDVTVYLNNRYYSFPCPEAVCRSGQAGTETQRKLAHSRADPR